MDTEMIHKKNGRLHIYVRQDKYKGELKSHNWVGRTYINGKQKISSSGTTNLDEAIPILEKWYDDLHINNEKNNNIPKVGEEISKTDESVPKTDEPIPRVFDSSPKIETSTPTENKSAFKPETQKKQDQTTIIDQEQGYQIT